MGECSGGDSGGGAWGPSWDEVDRLLAGVGGETGVADRMAALDAFIALWHGRNRPGDGYPEDRLRGHERPGPLRAWYRAGGLRRGVLDGQNRLPNLEDLFLDEDGRLVFYVENQGYTSGPRPRRGRTRPSGGGASGTSRGRGAGPSHSSSSPLACSRPPWARRTGPPGPGRGQTWSAARPLRCVRFPSRPGRVRIIPAGSGSAAEPSRSPCRSRRSGTADTAPSGSARGRPNRSRISTPSSTPRGSTRRSGARRRGMSTIPTRIGGFSAARGSSRMEGRRSGESTRGPEGGPSRAEHAHQRVIE